MTPNLTSTLTDVINRFYDLNPDIPYMDKYSMAMDALSEVRYQVQFDIIKDPGHYHTKEIK